MENREIQQLAIELEGDELAGEEGRLLAADDIAPVIEALWSRGVDFDGLLGGDDEVTDDRALDSVSSQD